jgi:hypothetical protein
MIIWDVTWKYTREKPRNIVKLKIVYCNLQTGGALKKYCSRISHDHYTLKSAWPKGKGSPDCPLTTMDPNSVPERLPRYHS